MSGIKTNTVDLGKAANKLFAAIHGEDARKREFINEWRHYYIKQGFAPWMAVNLAIEKWRAIHK